MKCVFLDFDGVLVNRESWHVRSGGMATAHPSCVAALNKITDATDAVIVVSSTWRRGSKVVELREILSRWGVTAPVIDKTPDMSRAAQESLVISGALRGHEIAAWLKMREESRGDVESFVILDDDNDMAHLMPYLVRTNFDIGLTDEHVDRAIDVLLEAA